MTVELDIEYGRRQPVPVLIPPTAVSFTPFPGGGTLAGWSLRDATSAAPNQAEGTQAAPGAGVVIAQLTGLPAGTYNINWSVELEGPVAAADNNNMVLFTGAGNVQIALAPPAAGVYPQQPVEVTIPAGGTIGIKAIGAATAGTTYGAQFSISPTLELECIVELKDGQNILSEFASGTVRSWSQWFGPDGPPIVNGLQVSVISGAVTGVVFIIPSYP